MIRRFFLPWLLSGESDGHEAMVFLAFHDPRGVPLFTVHTQVQVDWLPHNIL